MAKENKKKEKAVINKIDEVDLSKVIEITNEELEKLKKGSGSLTYNDRWPGSHADKD